MNEPQLLNLIELLYDGILAPSGWAAALNELARYTTSDAASLVLWSRKTDQAVVGDQVGLPAELVNDYAAHFHQLDPGRGFVDRIATGDWYVDERDLGAAFMHRSAFYQDFLRRYDLDSTMASPFLRTNGMDGFLSLSSPAGRRDLPAIARSLRYLMPHFERAAKLRVKLLDLTQQAQLQAHVLDRFNFPLAVVTAESKVVLANALAERWLASPGNPLARGSRLSSHVAAMLHAACGVGQARKASGMKVQKKSGSEYFLTAVPLPASASAAGIDSAPVALLFVTDPENTKPQAGDLLRQIFRLTPAEVRLIAPIMQGNTLPEACEQLQISRDTGRTQLQSIFGKLGVRRQADLIRLLGNLAIVDQGPDA
jgi:DNA-binding CsgD family transcriptional regulator